MLFHQYLNGSYTEYWHFKNTYATTCGIENRKKTNFQWGEEFEPTNPLLRTPLQAISETWVEH